MSDSDPPGPDLARAALDQAKAAAARRRSPTPEDRSEAASRRAARRRSSARGREGADPVMFGRAIRDLLSARGWEGEAKVASVMGRWPELVGADVAEHCTPVSLRDGELVLAAESTAWATQLRLLSRTLLQRLSAELGPGTVTRLRVHGPVSGQPRGGWRVRGGKGPGDTWG